MNVLGPWQTDDFEMLSWHDVRVHGLALDEFDPREGTCDLLLDIDFILEWGQDEDGYTFKLAPALLRFKSTHGLKIDLDYAAISAGMCPFCLNRIDRESVQYPTGHKSYRWRLEIDWPPGLIAFEAPGFHQHLRGTPQVQRQQWLQHRVFASRT